MTEGQKSIALAVSVTLNVVLIAAIAGGLFFARQAWKERAERTPLFQIARTLPAADETLLRDQMRAAGREARPVFRVSREHRRKAAALAAAPAYDRAKVLNELVLANSAEMRARAILDNQLTSALAGLSPESRKKMAPVLEHRSRGMRGRRGRDKGLDDRAAPPPADAPPA